jgi:hypothetical protein
MSVEMKDEKKETDKAFKSVFKTSRSQLRSKLNKKEKPKNQLVSSYDRIREMLKKTRVKLSGEVIEASSKAAVEKAVQTKLDFDYKQYATKPTK